MTTDAKDTKMDAVPKKGGDSDGKSRQDSAQPKRYTEDEVEQKFSSQRAALDKNVHRLEQQLEAANRRVADAEAKEAERQREIDEAAVRDADGDPIKLTTLQKAKKAREAEADLAKRIADFTKKEAEQQEKLERIEAAELKTAIKEIAEKFKVNVKQLEGLGLTDKDTIENIARTMANAKPFEPDSGENIGGGVTPVSAKGKMLSAWEKIHPND